MLLGWGGYPRHPCGHPVLPGVVFGLIFGSILDTLDGILEPIGSHSRIFFGRMRTKVQLVDRKSCGACPECIFGAPRSEKVRFFKLADVAKVLYIMYGFDISLFLIEAASKGDFGARNCAF